MQQYTLVLSIKVAGVYQLKQSFLRSVDSIWPSLSSLWSQKTKTFFKKRGEREVNIQIIVVDSSHHLLQLWGNHLTLPVLRTLVHKANQLIKPTKEKAMQWIKIKKNSPNAFKRQEKMYIYIHTDRHIIIFLKDSQTE